MELCISCFDDRFNIYSVAFSGAQCKLISNMTMVTMSNFLIVKGTQPSGVKFVFQIRYTSASTEKCFLVPFKNEPTKKFHSITQSPTIRQTGNLIGCTVACHNNISAHCTESQARKMIVLLSNS